MDGSRDVKVGIEVGRLGFGKAMARIRHSTHGLCVPLQIDRIQSIGDSIRDGSPRNHCNNSECKSFNRGVCAAIIPNC
jgi:hypothetical protein